MVGIPGASLAQLHIAQTLPVAEVFGPTVQGEGPHTGRRCWFVRLGDCNLHCSWCDTKFTWDWQHHDRDAELEDLTVVQVVDRLRALGARHSDMVVLTGGEPLIHHHKAAFRELIATGYSWHLESNGTIWPGGTVARLFTHVTLSVKIGQTDDPEKRRIKPKAIARWVDWGVCWKFVVRDGYDVKVVADLTRQYGIPPDQVWCMAEGTKPMKFLQRQADLADTIVGYGFNLSTRLHLLAWPESDKGR
jgi:7-carboxy-7-deazaguanine synthase